MAGCLKPGRVLAVETAISRVILVIHHSRRLIGTLRFAAKSCADEALIPTLA